MANFLSMEHWRFTEMKNERGEFKHERTSKLEQAVVALQASVFRTE